MSKDSYVIYKRIGKGGQGVVYLAKNMLTHQYVCIKKINRNFTDEKRGISLMKTVCHPHFPKTIEVYEDETFYYHVMEYIDGKSLLNYHHQISTAKSIDIGLQLLEMVAALNKEKLTFNDLKPDNILMTRTHQIYIIDYGSVLKQDDLFSVRYGSLAFCSPEFISKKQVTWKSDVYSIAKVLSYICINPSLKLKNWIKKATKTNENERFNSIFEAYEKLKRKYLIYVLGIFIVLFYFLKPQVVSMILDCSSSNPFLLHSMNLYDELNEKQKLQLSNEYIGYQDEIYWKIQYQLCCDATENLMRDRYSFMKSKSIESVGLTQDNLYFYLHYLMYLKDETKLEVVYLFLNELPKKETYIEKCMIEIAFYLKNEQQIMDDCIHFSNVSKAWALYRLFLLGNYEKGYLHEALDLLKNSKEYMLISTIEKEIEQWGEYA